MKALILLATLKKNEPSNTETLSRFFTDKLSKKGVECETIKLVNENILPGTYSDMGKGDAWPAILDKILAAEILIFATPIWWGSHSSEMQKVVERLDNLHDEILAGQPSRLQNKVAGIIITGDSDGAEQLIGVLSNFMNAVGVLVPPYCTLSVLWEGQKKGEIRPKAELLQKYESEYASTADKMVQQLMQFAQK
jgi:multimeric flavodoxin WrbA